MTTSLSLVPVFRSFPSTGLGTPRPAAPASRDARVRLLLIVVAVCLSHWPVDSESIAARLSEELKPGLAYIFFDDGGFQRPGSHGVDKQIKSHGVVTDIKSHGVDKEIDLETEGINGYSRLWIGRIRFPMDGEVTFSTEVDNGMRLYVGDESVIDAWAEHTPRQGKIRVAADQTLPLRVEYFQSEGPSYLRLYWQWKGVKREIVPASAFWHTDEDWELAEAIAHGKRSYGAGYSPAVVSIPSGDEEFKSAVYQKLDKPVRPDGPIVLKPGPHLFVDDYLIEKTNNVTRRVNRPKRDPKIPNPIITGKEDHCVAPYTTVIRDPATNRFRIWYNVYKAKHQDGTARFAYMESEDGIHWIRPHRVLKDPGAINFGSSVIDEGPDFADPTQRYKLAWWAGGGLNIAVSANGLQWTMFRPYPVLRHNHDINNIFWDDARNRYQATVSVFTTGPTWKDQRRTTMTSVSEDLVNWKKPWYVITADDTVDKDFTQFYAMQGYLNRGELMIGLVKVLHDDWVAPETPQGAFGVGYTTLAWTRDGEHWVRDIEPFFEPDPDPNAWDHAHAWLDWQLQINDEVYIYYGGYKYGHKMDRWEGRQIGLVKMPRDRYVSRDVGTDGGTLCTPPVILPGNKMTVNAAVAGELRVRLLDQAGKPIPAFDADDCHPIQGDSLTHSVQWKAAMTTLRDRPVKIEFILHDARLYAFELTP